MKISPKIFLIYDNLEIKPIDLCFYYFQPIKTKNSNESAPVNEKTGDNIIEPKVKDPSAHHKAQPRKLKHSSAYSKEAKNPKKNTIKHSATSRLFVH